VKGRRKLLSAKMSKLCAVSFLALLALSLAACPIDSAPGPDRLLGYVAIHDSSGNTLVGDNARNPEVGETLTAYVDRPGGTGGLVFQWRRGAANIDGANSNTLTVDTLDIGHVLTVIVIHPDHTGAIVGGPTLPVVDPNLPRLSGTVQITGLHMVGRTLTANTDGLFGVGSVSFQWMRGVYPHRTPIARANYATYTLLAADIGNYIHVIVTRAGNSGYVSSDAIGPVIDDDPEIPLPTVTGVTITPASISLQRGLYRDFIVTVEGTGDFPQTVIWSINRVGLYVDIHPGTAIQAGGRLTVALDEENNHLIVRATSTFDISIYGAANVRLFSAGEPDPGPDYPDPPPDPDPTITINISFANFQDRGPQIPSQYVSYMIDQSVLITVSTPGQYDNIRWYLDGIEVPGFGGLNETFNFVARRDLLGVNNLTVVVDIGDRTYSTIIRVTVSP